MATELTSEEYADRHSLFTATERLEYRKREHILLLDVQALIRFWDEKRETFLQRIAMRLMA